MIGNFADRFYGKREFYRNKADKIKEQIMKEVAKIESEYLHRNVLVGMDCTGQSRENSCLAS